jgi:hypothetical protein
MEEIKAPKKERRFLKAVGEVALTLFRELLLGVGKKVINKVGNKRERLVIAIIVLASSFAFAQYPTTGNKQRLGYQTTGDGLVWRGRASDTVALKSSTINNSYVILDTVNNVMYVYIKTKGGWQFNNSDTVIIQGVTMPFDSITFNTAKNGTVGVGEVEYNDTQGSLIQGLKGGLVTNVIGQQLHQRVNNQTGVTLTKGTAIYLSGSQGNRITVAKALGVTDAFSANTFGIVAESIADNQSGYVITEGLIKDINTSALTEGAAVYLSPTVAGGLTSTKPQAPQHTVYIGVCVKSNAGSGELFVKIFNGQELEELHNVRITNPSNNASLYYKSNESLWRDTTAALLVSDTASMLTNYLRTGVAAATYQTKLTNPITGNGSNLYFPIFTSSSNITQSLLRWDGNSIPNSTFINDYNINQFGGSLTVTGIANFSNQITISGSVSGSNRLLGKNTSNNGVGDVTVGTGLNLSGSNVLTATGVTSVALTAPSIFTVAGSPITTSGTLALTYSGTALPIANGGTGATSSSAARTALGATTLGSDLFTITNPSAITFPRFNTNNTVSALDAATFRTAIGAGTGNGNGTVTSVSAGIPANGLTVATGTTTPVISMALAGSGTIGVVSATTQTFGGDKTFNGIVNANSDLNVTGLSTLTGGATIGTMSTQSALTNILGVNSSNTIGEIGLNSVFSLSSGVLNIQEAGSSQRGIVTATTQSFGGDKTFTDKVGFTKAIQRPIATISGNTTIQTSNCWIIVNNTGGTTTLTLPDATLATGTELMIKTAQAQAVISASSNVVPLTFANTASTSILPATDGAWCTLVSNGTFWVIMQANF